MVHFPLWPYVSSSHQSLSRSSADENAEQSEILSTFVADPRSVHARASVCVWAFLEGRCWPSRQQSCEIDALSMLTKMTALNTDTLKRNAKPCVQILSCCS